MSKRHVIISGTGRAGTTFLVQLLTHLGLDTGFEDPYVQIHPHCDAGMELDIRSADAPYIVKSTWLCHQIGPLLDSQQIVIEHAIVPMRDIYSAAQSRRSVSARTDPSQTPVHEGHIPGGVLLTDNPELQEIVLAEQFYELLYALTKHSIKTTLLLFPRIVLDPQYLYDQLADVLGEIGYTQFLESFQSVVRPDLVHDFTGDS